MEPFKNIFNKKSVEEIANAISKHSKSFNSEEFCKLSLKGINKLELKQRVEQISNALLSTLTSKFGENCRILIKSLKSEKNQDGLHGFLVWPLTHYIEVNGLNSFDESMNALYHMTKQFTAEFAIRPFLENHYENTFELLHKWKNDECEHIRRLVSEGTRPNLPWGQKVLKINENMPANIGLIMHLKKDESEYVRKSVANHLNDISHHDEKLFFKAIKQLGKSKNEQWIARRASRTLLKKGNPNALKIHGYNPSMKLNAKLKITNKKIKEGDRFSIKYKIDQSNDKKENVLIEYGIHYLKKNGEYSRKVFRIKDTHMNKSLSGEKEIHFKKVTTRVHYPGKHYIDIQINGKIFSKISFELIA